MYTSSPLFILSLSIGILSLNLFVLVGFLFLVTFVLKNSTAARKEAAEIKRNATEEAEHILAQAREQALKYTEDAQGKAREIIGTTDAIHSGLQETLEKDLETFSQSQKVKLAEVVQASAKKYEEVIVDMGKKSDASLLLVAERLANVAEKGIVDLNATARATLDDYEKKQALEIKKAQDDLGQHMQVYKEMRLKKADQAFEEAFSAIARDLFGKVLRREDHEELIRQALERIAQEGFFN